jgi:homoserine kinase type II
MGVKIKITQNDLPVKYQKYPLIPTTDGVQSSVYLLGDKYVLKIYDDPKYNIHDEIWLLNIISSLKAIQFVEYFKIDEMLFIIYKQIAGDSLYKPTTKHIKSIALFLKNYHTITSKKTHRNTMLFTKEYLENMIIQTKNTMLLDHFKNIKITLKNDGIIHGDLFPDNVKWLDNNLSGVYDFTEACNGDFIFDLAVVASSWCFDEDKPNYEKINTLLHTYGLDMPIEKFNEYIKYALLYYATTRYKDNRDFQELLNRLEKLNKDHGE